MDWQDAAGSQYELTGSARNTNCSAVPGENGYCPCDTILPGDPWYGTCTSTGRFNTCPCFGIPYAANDTTGGAFPTGRVRFRNVAFDSFNSNRPVDMIITSVP